MVSNMRLNPADTVEGALEYLRKTAKDDGVEITALESCEPSRISTTDCEGWRKVCGAVSGTWPEAIVSPYLMIQCSDSRHWGRICDKVYRFSAMDLSKQERSTIHGHNERVRLECIHRAVAFYLRLLQQC
jgi:carboxypeptidase PM20D1